MSGPPRSWDEDLARRAARTAIGYPGLRKAAGIPRSVNSGFLFGLGIHPICPFCEERRLSRLVVRRNDPSSRPANYYLCDPCATRLEGRPASPLWGVRRRFLQLWERGRDQEAIDLLRTSAAGHLASEGERLNRLADRLTDSPGAVRAQLRELAEESLLPTRIGESLLGDAEAVTRAIGDRPFADPKAPKRGHGSNR